MELIDSHLLIPVEYVKESILIVPKMPIIAKSAIDKTNPAIIAVNFFSIPKG